MAKIKIKLNEKHLKLIKEFKVNALNDVHVGFDTINPYGGQYLMEDLAMILGYWDKTVIGTESDYDGRKFGLENEQEMIDVHNYVMHNFEFIISIIIQFSTIGGLKVGEYSAVDYNLIWEYKP